MCYSLMNESDSFGAFEGRIITETHEDLMSKSTLRFGGAQRSRKVTLPRPQIQTRLRRLSSIGDLV